jgi:phosphatidylglycerol lysyltransferase
MRRAVGAVGRTLSDYRVVLGVLAVCAAATWIANDRLGAHPTMADIEDWGYGLPSIRAGRLWTLLTGMVLVKDLSVPVPTFSLIGVVLYEHVAKHWRTAAVLVGGQVLGVLAVSLLLFPVRDVDGWCHDMAQAIDFGMSVGGFATLGAWTAYLSDRWRRPTRLLISCYFPLALVMDHADKIYDLTHPAGWIIGMAMGAWLRDLVRSEPQSKPSPLVPGFVLLAVIEVTSRIAG